MESRKTRRITRLLMHPATTVHASVAVGVSLEGAFYYCYFCALFRLWELAEFPIRY